MGRKSTDVPAEEVIDEAPVDTTPEDDEEGLLTLDYSRLVIVLWGVCKDLSTRLNELENNMNQKAKKDTYLNNNMYIFCVLALVVVAGNARAQHQ